MRVLPPKLLDPGEISDFSMFGAGAFKRKSVVKQDTPNKIRVISYAEDGLVYIFLQRKKLFWWVSDIIGRAISCDLDPEIFNNHINETASELIEDELKRLNVKRKAEVAVRQLNHIDSQVPVKPRPKGNYP